MIPVYNQILTVDDAESVKDVILRQFVTHIGQETSDLEDYFANFCNKKYSLACSNGTAALHLALVGLNLHNKTIAIQSCTFAAVAFAPAYLNCNTVFIDVDKDGWNIDLWLLEQECKKQRIDAVIAAHNYGNPYDYNRLKALSDKYKFFIIEDACEAFGSSYYGEPIGKFGDVSVFSFYGNKMVTGGEGGILLTDLEHVANKVKLFRGQAQSRTRKFWHEDIGHNFRITNMQSALILSQLKRKEELFKKSRENYRIYRSNLPKHLIMQKQVDGADSCWWMICVLHQENANFYDIASQVLKDEGFDSRPIFPPLPRMPPWYDNNKHKNFPVSEMLTSYGITLPSGPGITEDNIKLICRILNEI